MKKAYVKPVFVAEEFVAEASVAACVNASVNDPLTLEIGQNICYKLTNNGVLKADGHQIGGAQGGKGDALLYWGSANADAADPEVYDNVKLFTNASIECDFLWYGSGSHVQAWSKDGTEENIVWKEEDRKGLTLATNYSFKQILQLFFCGTGADNDNHIPGYNGYAFFS